MDPEVDQIWGTPDPTDLRVDIDQIEGPQI